MTKKELIEAIRKSDIKDDEKISCFAVLRNNKGENTLFSEGLAKDIALSIEACMENVENISVAVEIANALFTLRKYGINTKK